jgi:hypothetical protein
MEETWKIIPDFPDYEIGDGGHVRRITASASRYSRAKVGKVLKPSFNGRGKPHVSLIGTDGQKHTVQIAPLVMSAFGDKPSFLRPQIEFSDGNSANCSIYNLKWIERYSKIVREKLPMTPERLERKRNVRNKSNKAYRKRNLDRVRKTSREKARLRYASNPDRARESSRRWAQKNVDATKETQRAYRAKNRELLNDRKKHKINTDIRFRMKTRMGTQLSRRLKRRITGKGGNPTFEILGYSVDILIAHLEKLFLHGMTWDNYGEWHIDHVKPDSYFKYSSVDDDGFKQSWALQNLQPLWRIDNIRKSNRLDWNPQMETDGCMGGTCQ